MYHWSEISNIEEEAGIYAWYYKLIISKRDIKKFLKNIQYEKEKEGEPKKLAKKFVRKNILDFFKEEEYSTKLKGKLKPTYKGKVEHEVDVSNSLVEKIVKKPTKLFEVKKTLEEAIPEFTSPIYIGKAKNLQERLKNHKKLIRKKSKVSEENGQSRDEDFAIRVNKNSMRKDFLYVSVKTVKKDAETEVENILNRVSFPIYGRK